MKSCFWILFFLMGPGLQAADTVRVLFVYGSVPKTRGESFWFGGIHGGHVSVGALNRFVSFVPAGKFRIFPRRTGNSAFITEDSNGFVFDTSNSRYLIVSIPVSQQQRRALDSVCRARLDSAEYEYGFFGMRCASAAYDLLSSAGIVKKKSRRAMVRKFFYPKLLRKWLMKEAKDHSWQTLFRPGRPARKWERD